MIRLAHPDKLANFLDRRGLDDRVGSTRFAISWRADMTGADDRREPVREI